jgi:hypothetical protein
LAFSALLKWGRLDGQISSVKTDSECDVDTAQELELQDQQDDVQRLLLGQIDQLLSGHKSPEDSSFQVKIPKRTSQQSNKSQLPA